jgi:hypothetical protein
MVGVELEGRGGMPDKRSKADFIVGRAAGGFMGTPEAVC